MLLGLLANTLRLLEGRIGQRRSGFDCCTATLELNADQRWRDRCPRHELQPDCLHRQRRSQPQSSDALATSLIVHFATNMAYR